MTKDNECECEKCSCSEDSHNTGWSDNVAASTIQDITCGFSFYTDADEETGSDCN